MTKCCQHLNISGVKYGQSSRQWMSDPVKSKEVTCAESASCKDLGPGVEITAEKAIEAYKLKVKRDIELFRKL